ncbi:YpiF family protein [Bacillus taeanensis]|uniref:DUF2487 domain-containing protein n=1 Tax=Bacillus taeanensis TaxID=273032 RepID=A0A366XXH6_9BACI|nr:YpiF family protein [Bacillus taeanensis]RBW70268.1 DUF2487 domain-containing protein [Bacillus taeanensis]
MKWTSKNIEAYMQSKEYVDTALIPLLPINWKTEIKGTVAMGEYITIIIAELERQLHGRVLEFPPYTYLKNEQFEEHVSRLKNWTEEIKAGGMKHVFYFTADNEWKQHEEQLDAPLIWMPVVPLEHMDERYKLEIVQDQTKQLLQIVTKKWQNQQ